MDSVYEKFSKMVDIKPVASSSNWQPEVNEKLVGCIQKIREVENKFSDKALYSITVKDYEQDRTVSVLCGCASLQVINQSIESCDIVEGDFISLKYLGFITTKSGRQAKNYSVYFEPKKKESKPVEEDSDSFQDDIPF